MRICPLCGLENENTDLTRHYLKEPRLVHYIQGTHKDWKPEDGACSRCLETFFRESSVSGTFGADAADEKTVITATNDLIEENAVEQGGASLITIHGGDLGKKYDLTMEETILGRGETTQVRINEENVSRQHAKIFKKGSEIILEDLHSTNGTFVNTKKITAQALKDGDLILIGNTILKFVSGSHVENQYHEEIYRLATMDGLTQIYNKNFFLDKLADEFSRSRRYSRELSLILFDFDHFKEINDTHGHAAGDIVLKKTSSLIMRNMRKEDVFGRYGGEEFGILLPETPLENAVRLAEKIRKMVHETPFLYENKNIQATISAGVAALSKDLKSAEQFIKKADQALYNSKNSGRNCVRS